MSTEDPQEVAVTSLSPPPEPLIPTAPPPPSPLPPSPPSAVVMKNVPTIFGEVLERDVTFCLDTSGSMFRSLHVVQEHLIEALMKHAHRQGDTTFNIIEFNSEVTQWADKMVVCTPETVQVAADWIQKLGAKTGTNTLDALLTAFQDPACQSVYLVTDGLPDTFAEDILDVAVNAADGRPIHCIYLTGEKADAAAVEFLEDLAVESFGSFHVVTLTSHGCVERVTPIYRSEHASERVIRTVNNTLRPNFRTCSVATTLQIDPEEVLGEVPRASPLGLAYGVPPPLAPSWWAWRYWGLGMHPYRYHFPHSWSRYRPAKAWLKAQDKMAEIPDALGLSPAAGSLLIGKQVLARRIADGYFYRGTVQSQILEDKFLVGFGPCKHGKYRETTYQDTFVFDIVDFVDAQRHTIITGDHVLAPWEPEGERYSPGIVIDGQEKRQSIECQTAGPEDHQLTVTFSNGRTEKVALDKAIWVPQPVFQRVSLELKMPPDTRSTIMTTDHYPLRSLPGYPTSGPQAAPTDFYTPEHFALEPAYGGWDGRVYPEYLGYYPPYPLVVRRRPEGKAVKREEEEEEDAVIPGTAMTRKELEERIQSQICELGEERHGEERHRAERHGEERQRAERHREERQAAQSSRLLRRREKLEENTLKKSVSFNDSDLVQVRDCRSAGGGGDADSGIASSPEPDPMVQEQLEQIEEERRVIARERRMVEEQKRLLEEEELRMWGLTPEMLNDPRLEAYRSRSSVLGKRPPWQYWRNEPSPPVSAGGDGGSGGGGGGGKSHRGFRETALQAPLEARDQRRHPYIVEWTSPAFKYVDTFAKHDYSNSVSDCLKPSPPQAPAEGEEANANYVLTRPRPPTEDEKAQARRQYRRRRHIERDAAWQERLMREGHMKLLMEDGHRERVRAQIARETEKQQQEQDMILKAREAKKKISQELRERVEGNEMREKEREESRLKAMQQRRERREAMEVERQKEFERGQQRAEEIRRQNNVARHNAQTAKLEEEDAKSSAVERQHRNAKLQRIRLFHTMEDQARAKKDLRVGVTDQHLALYRSQIFP